MTDPFFPSVMDLEGAAPPWAPTVEYVRGGGIGGGVGGLLYSVRPDDDDVDTDVELSFGYFNSRGDVIAKTDGSGLAYQAAYEARGKRIQEIGTTPDIQRANTKDEDPTGLLNDGFRYRDLETGTFLTRDPAGFVDGPNLYAYVRQNPWTYFDPEGLSLWSAMLDVFWPGYSKAEANERRWRELRGGSYTPYAIASTDLAQARREYATAIDNAGSRLNDAEYMASVEAGYRRNVNLALGNIGAAAKTQYALAQPGLEMLGLAASFGSGMVAAEFTSLRATVKAEKTLSLDAAKETQHVSVLGTYLPNNGKTYVQFAEEIGARRFALPDVKFTALVKRAETVHGNPLHYNQLYLDSIVKRKDLVRMNISRPEMDAILESNPNAFKTLRWEIDDLLNRGYNWCDDLKSLVPGKN